MRARSLAVRVALAVAAGALGLLVSALAASAKAPRAERAAGTRSSTTGVGQEAPAPKLSPSSAGTITRRLSVAAIPTLHAASSSGVTVVGFQFKPSAVTVNVGDTVSWTNDDPVEHTATATSGGSFDVDLPTHGSGSHTFNQAGTYNYFCKIHPNMKASITVTGGSSGGASSSGGSATSGGGGGSSGAGSSGSSPSSAGSSGPSSNPLPHTGLQIAGLVLTGLALLGLGLVLRRGVRYPTR